MPELGAELDVRKPVFPEFQVLDLKAKLSGNDVGAEIGESVMVWIGTNLGCGSKWPDEPVFPKLLKPSATNAIVVKEKILKIVSGEN